jgi:UDP-N-acetylmuramoyl-L-alanyl-D-glutamate--2,6-diaminopimelate ligase
MPFYHLLWAAAGVLWYGDPSRGMVVIGVTGTKGKSSVVYLLARSLEREGVATAALSSIEIKVGEDIRPNTTKMTMPGRLFVWQFLARAKQAGCKYAIIEVTSQGILQHRHRFINFDTMVFTNLQREHIEAHGSYAAYRDAKLAPFRAIAHNKRKVLPWRRDAVKKRIIANIDDVAADFFLSCSADEKIGYGLGAQSVLRSDLTEVIVPRSADYTNGITLTIDDSVIFSPLAGRFNAYNLLAVAAVCYAEGIGFSETASRVKNISTIPGRFEYVAAGQLFAVVVDYAHTPDSLLELYGAAATLRKSGGKMICVLGSAGGGRDKWKRPEMAALAEKNCDVVIFTNEDPYDEDPNAILDEMEKGLSDGFKKNAARSIRILDRREALAKAVSLAHAGDALVSSGKGSEKWIMTKDGKIPWNEKKILEELLTKNK